LDWRNSHVLGGGGLHEAIYKPPSFLNRLNYGTTTKEKKTKGKAQSADYTESPHTEKG
jgi:hypothetical protein